MRIWTHKNLDEKSHTFSRRSKSVKNGQKRTKNGYCVNSPLLIDRKTYKVLTRNPVPLIEKRLNFFIWKLSQEEKISFSNYKSPQNCGSVLPRIYGLLKIHKTTIFLRPIVSFIGSATYHLSKCLTCILSALAGKTNFTTKNSTEFVKSIKDFSISDSQKRVSFDVISLFTTKPLDLAKQIVFDRLVSSDSHLEDRTTLSVPELMEALDICFCSISFTFQQTV